MCPACGKHSVEPKAGTNPASGWNPNGPRAALDFTNGAQRSTGYLLARECVYTIKGCKHNAPWHSFSSSSPGFVALLPAVVQRQFPAHLTHKGAVTVAFGAKLVDAWGETEAFNAMEETMSRTRCQQLDALREKVLDYAAVMDVPQQCKARNYLVSSAGGALSLATVDKPKKDVWVEPRGAPGHMGQGRPDVTRKYLIALAEALFEVDQAKRAKLQTYYAMGPQQCSDATFKMNKALGSENPYVALQTFVCLTTRMPWVPRFVARKGVSAYAKYIEAMGRDHRARHRLELDAAAAAIWRLAGCEVGGAFKYSELAEVPGPTLNGWSALHLTTTLMRAHGLIKFIGKTTDEPSPEIQILADLSSDLGTKLHFATSRINVWYSDECCQIPAQLVQGVPDLLYYATEEEVRKATRFAGVESTVHRFARQPTTFVKVVEGWAQAGAVVMDFENTVTFEKGCSKKTAVFAGCYDIGGAWKVDLLHVPDEPNPATGRSWWSGGADGSLHPALAKLRAFLENENGPGKIGVNIKGDFTKLKNQGIAPHATGYHDLADIIEDCLGEPPKSRSLESLIKACGLDAAKPGDCTAMDFDSVPLGRAEQVYTAFDAVSVAIAVMRCTDPTNSLAAEPAWHRPSDLLLPPADAKLTAAGGCRGDTFHANQRFCSGLVSPVLPESRRWVSMYGRCLHSQKLTGVASKQSAADAVKQATTLTGFDEANAVKRASQKYTLAVGPQPEEMRTSVEVLEKLIRYEDACRINRGEFSNLRGESGSGSSFDAVMKNAYGHIDKGCLSSIVSSDLPIACKYDEDGVGKALIVKLESSSLDEALHGQLNKLVRSGASANFIRATVLYRSFTFGLDALAKGLGPYPTYKHYDIELVNRLNNRFYAMYGKWLYPNHVDVSGLEFSTPDDELDCFPGLRVPGLKAVDVGERAERVAQLAAENEAAIALRSMTGADDESEVQPSLETVADQAAARSL